MITIFIFRSITHFRALKYQLLYQDKSHEEPFRRLHHKYREHYIEMMAHMNLLRENDKLDEIRIEANKLLG